MDPTELVLSILDGVTGAPVTTEVPSDRPGRMVTVALEQDRSTPYLLRPTYDIMCWGDSDRDAASMARACVDALWEAALDHPYLSACSLQTLSRDSWGRTGQARYVAVVDLTINID